MTRHTADYDEALLAEARADLAAGRHLEAAEGFRRLLAQAPADARGLSGLGLALNALNKPDEAVKCFVQSLKAVPDQADVLYNFGLSLKKLNRLDLAGQAFRESARCDPAGTVALKALGLNLQAQGQAEAAVEAYRRALRIDPDDAEILALLIYQLRQTCDWTGIEALEQRLLSLVRRGAADVPPFILLTIDSEPADQLAVARAWSRWREVAAAARLPPVPAKARVEGERLRVGYLSADYHEHATAYLVVELFERHDRAAFEIFAYSSGPDDVSPMRRRLLAAVDHFVPVRALSDRDAAARIRSDGIDILVDLKGYTQGTRAGILAFRPAPVQVSFLGYPGTSGAGFVDWLIADAVVIPPGHQRFYSERLALMPGCYQPNDRQRPIAEPPPGRAECGLPDEGFVFCCFNSAYKLTPAFFALWMRLLLRVPGSVLWLFASNPWVELALRNRAVAAGVGADRLVFARDLPLARHLARYRLADLVLDTLPYGGHTTVSDALWAGAPAVTCAGAGFPGRVAASLLTAIGLPGLIAASPAEYEALALSLALDPVRLGGVRAVLAGNRLTTPLFDTERYTRDLEALYRAMV
ncbi:MAG: tetratricopeptide repeat protein [Rhodospirillaceae bacterium]